MLDRKLKKMLPLMLQHIQKTNEIISQMIAALQEEAESAAVNTAPVTSPQKPPKDIIGVAEAAEYCGYSKSYLYQLVHWNRIPYHKPTNGRIFFKRCELDEFLSNKKVSADYELAEQATAILNGEYRK
ncbi:MAG: helix-turn-helix domain-containing protein [Spirochaetaceae bacterium]|nr:helix-turn-helix domain-containing protein [Spirochaetaceae bacterium]